VTEPIARERTFYVEPHYASMIVVAQENVNWPQYLAFVQLGVEAGDDHSCYAAATLDLHGPPTPKVRWRRDTRRGVKLLQRATRSVHMAMLELASAYENGDFGLRPNPKKAFELFERAVSFGSIAGRYHLSRCYHFGIGTRRDPRKASRLFRAAAELGFPVDDDDGGE
jgi:TPR repeat protein